MEKGNRTMIGGSAKYAKTLQKEHRTEKTFEKKWLNAGEKTPIKRRELLLIKWCVAKALPKLVYEHTTDWNWCYCPNCYTILDREYMRYCGSCGQALSWHGTLKHAVRISYAEAEKRRKTNE